MTRLTISLIVLLGGLALGGMNCACCWAQQAPASAYSPAPVFDALPHEQWERVDRGVDRALAYLARQQQADGSFPTHIGGQPAITSLAVMAFLSRGHQPGVGPYGTTINRAIDYTIGCQRPDGLLLVDSPDQPATRWNHGGHTGLYNHAIAGLMLSEAYGMTDGERGRRLRPVVQKAIAYARKMQRRPGLLPLDSHGWRYQQLLQQPNKGEADLSVTGWYVMFYRSAKNAEFDVPGTYVEEAIAYVRRCFDEESGAFVYGPYPEDHAPGRGMTGAGLLCLTVSGVRDERIARSAGQVILDHPFDRYNEAWGVHDRFHYGAYYCSQGMFLLGGDYWRRFYPVLASTLLNNQSSSGSWSPEAPRDSIFGSNYTTALSVLALTPPYQLLPIYQR